MAVLDVDELESDRVGTTRGLDELVDQAIDRLVGHQRDAAGEPLVEDRIGVRGERLGAIPDVRAREAARVRELETEIEVAVRVRAEALAVRGDELVAERGERRLVALRHEELVGIGAAVVPHGDGFTAPDELGAARAETLPAAAGQIARLASGRSVPPFHRQDAETVADPHGAIDERLSKRRLRRRHERIVETEVDSGRFEVVPEEGRGLERRDADVPRLAHACRSRLS